MVFEMDIVPKEKSDFMKWYFATTEWTEDHSYNDPSVSTESLRSWFMEMIKEFPAMNGPFAVSDDRIDDPKVSDYSVGKTAIYTAFAWSEAESAFSRAKFLAQSHGLGFFDPQSEDQGIYFPDANGNLVRAFQTKSFWKRLFGR